MGDVERDGGDNDLSRVSPWKRTWRDGDSARIGAFAGSAKSLTRAVNVLTVSRRSLSVVALWISEAAASATRAAVITSCNVVIGC